MTKNPRTQWTSLATLLLAQPIFFGFGGIATAYDQTFAAVEACVLSYIGTIARPTAFGGLSNESTTDDAWLACAAGQDQALDTNDDLRVYVSDRNGDLGQNIGCTAWISNANWTEAYVMESLYACSTTGGCTSDPGRFAADAYIRFDDLPHGGIYASSVTCSIPPKLGSDVSVVKSLLWDEQ